MFPAIYKLAHYFKTVHICSCIAALQYRCAHTQVTMKGAAGNPKVTNHAVDERAACEGSREWREERRAPDRDT